jgi:hypothetical protein
MPPAGRPGERPPERPPERPAEPTAQPPTTGQQETQAQEPSTTPGAEAATGAETAAVSAPNMLGHLLYGSRSVTFSYNRAGAIINVPNPGSTSIVNPAVADDESPLPRDRVGFRFNFYDNAQQVTGFGPPVFTRVNGALVGTSFSQTKEYDVEEYNFYFEKTFLDGRASVELRVPFSTGLSSNLNLSAGNVTGPAAGGGFGVTTTPEGSLGSEDTQFGHMTLLFKGLAYCGEKFSLTGGLALGIPSGADQTVNINDFAGTTTVGTATIQRERNIHIDDATWSLSPFVAFLSTPTDRLFSQGFVQVDVPLNKSGLNYSETFLRGTPPPLPGPPSFLTLTPPFSVGDRIGEQTLLQLDWGAGYWVLRDPERHWITGIAPSLELHYTTTLDNADLVTLPADSLLHVSGGRLVQESPPVVGNRRNRVDILDMTTAVTFLLGDRATVATAVAFPLKKADDRTFDWEFQLQLNYYFGGFGRRNAPNF